MRRTKQNRIWNAAAVLLIAGLLTVTLSSGALASTVEESRIAENLASVQVPFVENDGQVANDRVRFYARTFGGTVFVEDGGVLTYSLPAGNESGAAIREFLSETEGTVPVGVDPSATTVSYFIGNDPDNWRSNLTTYNAVSLGEVCAGTTLSLRAYGDNVEKIFTVEPGANPEAIRVRVEGATDALRVNESGELEIVTAAGVVRFTKPVAFQVSADGTRADVAVAYTVCDRETYGFSVGDYDTARPLVIDPLLASTFIGGGSYDFARAVALDSSGNVYVAGNTKSSTYPTTGGAYDTSHNGGDYDVFVSKLSSDLSSLSASTFIGGGSSDYAYAVALDSSGSVYVAGDTWSSTYPTTGGAYDTVYDGVGDVFVSKLSSDLSSLSASTFIGGDSSDCAYAAALDSSGSVYVAGYTESSAYPTTGGAYNTSHNGDADVFVSKLSSDLSSLSASTFIGGGSSDYAYAVALDSSGSVYVAGYTESSTYPTTGGAYNTSYNGGYSDVFVSKLSSDLGSLSASTFIGGDSSDFARAVALDSSGSVYVAGETYSSTYPTTGGAYDTSHNGGDYDVFVSKLSSDLSSLSASTFIGGSSGDIAYAIALDSSGNVYVAGYTESSTYPTTGGAYDTVYDGGDDVFVSKLNSDLSSLSASTFIGGSGNDIAEAVALDSSGNVYVAGYTYSSTYPTTGGAYNTSHNGGADVFVSKLDRELSKICACDADGNPREQFASGESVYVRGNGLPESTNYKLWIQDEGVSEGKTLDAGEDPSATQEARATDGSGTLPVTGIWAIDANASATYDEWDIVADNEDAGNIGTYNAIDDALDSASVAGLVAPVPDLAAVVLFGAGLLALAGYFGYRRRKD